MCTRTAGPSANSTTGGECCHRHPVTSETVFEAASLTKVVASYVVLQLVDEGLLDLDTPLSEYFDYSRIAGDPAAQRITGRMVLTHTSGLPNWATGPSSPSSRPHRSAPLSNPDPVVVLRGGLLLPAEDRRIADRKSFEQLVGSGSSSDSGWRGAISLPILRSTPSHPSATPPTAPPAGTQLPPRERRVHPADHGG
ncbi:serine hydrolase [Rhodococcus hoagii]|nr:serine hydrolase [Prescottella equi]